MRQQCSKNMTAIHAMDACELIAACMRRQCDHVVAPSLVCDDRAWLLSLTPHDCKRHQIFPFCGQISVLPEHAGLQLLRGLCLAAFPIRRGPILEEIMPRMQRQAQLHFEAAQETCPDLRGPRSRQIMLPLHWQKCQVSFEALCLPDMRCQVHVCKLQLACLEQIPSVAHSKVYWII